MPKLFNNACESYLLVNLCVQAVLQVLTLWRGLLDFESHKLLKFGSEGLSHNSILHIFHFIQKLDLCSRTSTKDLVFGAMELHVDNHVIA